MLRALFSGAVRTVTHFANQNTAIAPVKRALSYQVYNRWTSSNSTLLQQLPSTATTNLVNAVVPSFGLTQIQQTRSLTKFSLNKGKRKSVKAVLKRFKRLDWGVWVRTHTGRHKKLFKKSPELRRRLRQHIFTNSTQSYMLDKMVTSFWRRPKYYIDDPYAPYHKRDEFFATKSKTFKV
ncbi:39S ribosomal protein L35, mitochondrial [Zeugodacus cucurbitae]|uniref:39S ribosomal protein L35, mitochondrial n=1 Tax=Zeugodacus cucurbitae TaxID=28588 RepID=UPI0023D95F4F|nr:39S ribosomal protein L35, mitochondrial [Zeugodacus cucurbitae]